MNNRLLERVTSVSDLGVIYDSNLSFQYHIDFICNKSSKVLSSIMRHSKYFLKSESFILLYNSYVRSCLTYASQVCNLIHWRGYSIHFKDFFVTNMILQ